jgi:hypothetical protein
VTPDEEATITAGLVRRSGRRTLLLTRRTLRYAVGARRVRLLPARRRLPHARRYTVTLELRVTDRAANVATIRRSVRVG